MRQQTQSSSSPPASSSPVTARICVAASAMAPTAASSAGHPRPVLVRADGRAEVLDCAGTLLGVVPEPQLFDVHADLGPGDAVVLYTDGVTEARRGGELFGETRLVEALALLAGQPAEAIASATRS